MISRYITDLEYRLSFIPNSTTDLQVQSIYSKIGIPVSFLIHKEVILN